MDDNVFRGGVLVALVWIAFALTFCTRTAPEIVRVTPAPVNVYAAPQRASVTTIQPPPVCPAAVCPKKDTPTLASRVWAFFVEYGLLIGAGVAVAAAAVAGWRQLSNLVGALLGKQEATPGAARAGVTVLTVGATAFAAFKAELGEQNPIILVVGGLVLIMPLIVRRFERMWIKLAVVIGFGVLLIAVPTLGVGLWPYFTEDVKDVRTSISGYQAIVGELQKIGPWTIVNVCVLVVIYAANALLALTQPKKP